MPRPPLPPLRLGNREIPLALPALVVRITFFRTWMELTPANGEAPAHIQDLLSFAALGLCWEAGCATALQAEDVALRDVARAEATALAVRSVPKPDEAAVARADAMLAAARAMAQAAAPTARPPARLAACGHDLLRYGEAVGEGLERQAPAMAMLREAGRCAEAIVDATMTPQPAAVQASADFSEAEPAPASLPVSSAPIAGSATPSAGAT